MSEQAADQRLMNNVNFMRVFLDSSKSSPYYFKHVDANSKNAGVMHFDRHFNPSLASDSHYFKSLSAAMSCVERHAGQDLTEAQQE